MTTATSGDGISCFKAYDVRGIVPVELNEEVAYRIGRAYAEVVRPKRVAVGRDVRPSGVVLSAAVATGLNDAGVDVLDIGQCGTEQVYFTVFHLGLDGGIMVTASHNPPEYNGMKFVREEAKPISRDSGLLDIERVAARGAFSRPARLGKTREVDTVDAYVRHLLGYVDKESLRPLRLACNPGNGCAGPILRRLEKELPFRIHTVFEEPDGSFPNGVPNPLLPENRSATSELVRESRADLGVAWDGDFDRCFFFDEHGEFVEGYYLVGLLAQAVLKQRPGSKIIHDPRLTWNTIEIVKAHGGTPIQCKTGHAFIKERMRAEDAAYGGEMSAHHYFRDFNYCDSGMIPWLLVAGLLSQEKRTLAELIAERAARYPVSGEINRKLHDADAALARIEARYTPHALAIDRTDGLGMEFAGWRFNVRKSNTEPLLRLNVESRGDRALMEQKTQELLDLIDEG
mgnify:CR=1 FL=1